MTTNERNILRGMAQNYWQQAMTLQDRMDTMATVGSSQEKEGQAKYFRRIMDHLIDTKLQTIRIHAQQLQAELDAILSN